MSNFCAALVADKYASCLLFKGGKIVNKGKESVESLCFLHVMDRAWTISE